MNVLTKLSILYNNVNLTWSICYIGIETFVVLANYLNIICANIRSQYLANMVIYVYVYLYKNTFWEQTPKTATERNKFTILRFEF